MLNNCIINKKYSVVKREISIFRRSDIGKPKAEVAAAFINKRVAGCKVVPYPLVIKNS